MEINKPCREYYGHECDHINVNKLIKESLYKILEDHKHHIRRSNYRCLICQKVFRNEHYMDKHLTLKHSYLANENGFCLADLCSTLRCNEDELQNIDVKYCREELFKGNDDFINRYCNNNLSYKEVRQDAKRINNLIARQNIYHFIDYLRIAIEIIIICGILFYYIYYIIFGRPKSYKQTLHHRRWSNKAKKN